MQTIEGKSGLVFYGEKVNLKISPDQVITVNGDGVMEYAVVDDFSKSCTSNPLDAENFIYSIFNDKVKAFLNDLTTNTLPKGWNLTQIRKYPDYDGFKFDAKRFTNSGDAYESISFNSVDKSVILRLHTSRFEQDISAECNSDLSINPETIKEYVEVNNLR